MESKQQRKNENQEEKEQILPCQNSNCFLNLNKIFNFFKKEEKKLSINSKTGKTISKINYWKKLKQKELVTIYYHIFFANYEKLPSQSKFYFEFEEHNKKSSLIFRDNLSDKNKDNPHWYSVTHNGQKIWPFNSKGNKQIQALTKTNFDSEREKENITFKKTKKGNWMAWRTHIQFKGTFHLKSIKEFSNNKGTRDLKKDLGQVDLWYLPKPVQFLKHLFKNMCPKNGLIVDFAADSGTAGCTVAELNKEDGGKRKIYSDWKPWWRKPGPCRKSSNQKETTR